MTHGSTDEISAHEAAEILGVTPDYIWRLCRKGKIGTKYGRSWVITRAEVEAYQHTRRRPGRPRKN